MISRIFPILAASLVLAPLAQAQDAGGDLAAQGKTIYMQTCMACHQVTGAGLPPVFPPLTKSPYVSGSAERLVAMILKGNVGPMTIDGKPYNNIMPPQEAALNDAKIAAVATYVRSSFGNEAGPVTAEQVAAARTKFADRKTGWTQPELDAWKD
jgi:mono/diheme cytochrome c family protein